MKIFRDRNKYTIEVVERALLWDVDPDFLIAAGIVASVRYFPYCLGSCSCAY